jgi:hypothetical protein
VTPPFRPTRADVEAARAHDVERLALRALGRDATLYVPHRPKTWVDAVEAVMMGLAVAAVAAATGYVAVALVTAGHPVAAAVTAVLLLGSVRLRFGDRADRTTETD